MRAWLVRGVLLAVVHATAQVLLAEFAVHHPLALGWARPLVLGLLVVLALVAGVLDARRPEPGLLWLKAALLAGWLAGLLGVLGRALLVDQTRLAALGDALTGGAAFTALLVLVPASAGLLAGRLLGRPNPPGQDVPTMPSDGARG